MIQPDIYVINSKIELVVHRVINKVTLPLLPKVYFYQMYKWAFGCSYCAKKMKEKGYEMGETFRK